MTRVPVLAALSMTIGFAVPLVLAEVTLRLLPTPSALQAMPVDATNPVLRFTPDRPFTFSRGWNFEEINRGHINNYGFVNDQDYDSTQHSPLLAVVGDSYVEALMVPYPETLQGRLSRCLGTAARVYSFGISGAPLSQYLAEAGFAREHFHPDGVVVVVVGNDFDESLASNASFPGFHYFREGPNGLVLERSDYAPGLARRLIRRSALVRYLRQNLPPPGAVVEGLKGVARSGEADGSRYVGNTAATFTGRRLEDSHRATDAFLALLPSYAGVPAGRIVLLLDGMRPDLYTEAGLERATGSYFDLMRRYLIAHAEREGFEVIDMQPRFIRRHAADGTRFEFPKDGHWNARGHEEAAAAVAGSRMFGQVTGGRQCLH